MHTRTTCGDAMDDQVATACMPMLNKTATAHRIISTRCSNARMETTTLVPGRTKQSKSSPARARSTSSWSSISSLIERTNLATKGETSGREMFGLSNDNVVATSGLLCAVVGPASLAGVFIGVGATRLDTSNSEGDTAKYANDASASNASFMRTRNAPEREEVKIVVTSPVESSSSYASASTAPSPSSSHISSSNAASSS
mmetsp:Transcript_5919/g.21381  ORF Transcript_5919/g.21381 Transcript_5919/m.21381 type:complete len:200 (-) Transcript_5919:518-1117(-)